MLYLLCLPLGLVVTGLSILTYSVYAAPDGFEDEEGFHQLEGAALPNGERRALNRKALSYK